MFSLKAPEFTLTEKSLLGLAKGRKFCSVGDKAKLYSVRLWLSVVVTLLCSACSVRIVMNPYRNCTDGADDNLQFVVFSEVGRV